MPPIRIILVVSLALNLFLAGILVGDYLRPRPGPGGAPRPVAFTEWVMQNLSPESRPQVEPLLVGLDGVMMKGLQDRDAQFQRLRDLIAAEPFDQGAVDNVLAELPEQRLESEREQWRWTSDLLKAVSPADRAVLVNIFFRRPGPPPAPGGFNGGPPNDPGQPRGPAPQ